MATLKYSDEDMALLTEDEREALMSEDEDSGEPEEVIPSEVQAKADDHADEEDKSAEGDDGDAVADPAADDAAQAAVAADQKAASDTPDQAKGDEPPAAKVQAQPVFVAAAPEDAEAKLAAIAQKVADARKQYNDGVIEFEQFDAIKDEAAEEKLTLRMSIERAQMAAEMSQQQARNEWIRTANTFAAQHGYNANPILFDTFDRVVVQVATSADGQNMSYEQVLTAAHAQMVAAGLGKAAPAVAAVAAPAAGKKAPVNHPQQPPNLALVPAADTSDAGGNNQYAALDKLASRDPEAYEAELAKMSESARDKYLRA